MPNLRGFLLVGLLCTALPVKAALNVFACEPEWASLSKEIGGDKLTIYSATTAKQDVHRIQARPSLIAKMRRADLLICTGAELEVGWLPLLIQRASNRHVLEGEAGHFMAAEQVELLDVLETVDRSMGDVHAGGNPHFHLDPQRVLTVAEALAKRLKVLDVENSGFYQSRYDDFAQRWQQAMQRWQQGAQALEGVKMVAHHKDWRYLASWLGLEEVATLEPKPGMPPTASHLAKLQKQMATQPAAVIVRTVYQSSRPSEWLAEKTGIPALQLPYTVGGSEQAQDLFGLFDDTLARLLNAVKP